ncbi:hypothetical protein BN946_scf184986.g10 [Trametes cinnabarina]|uniref:F-box domain-containing protein n=1 Tax=Pycnoporus cinnabarinus TaxID=5643 RepID=A0A060SQ26_PYCCI|nr:hypothetical protein BN946_scf184986.g10 [Trametes cinnabarina]
MIVEHIFDDYWPPQSWVASLATTCRMLFPHVESFLYDNVVLESCNTANKYLRSVIKPERPHRATAVRVLSLNIKRCSTIVKLFINAFSKLTNLFDLTLNTDTVELFDALLTTPPHLSLLEVGGLNYPPRFHDILTAQSRLKNLHIRFVDHPIFPIRDNEPRIPPLADGALLPSIKTLHLEAPLFPPTLITYSYPVTTLALTRPTHEQTAYALNLFRDTLVCFVIVKELNSRCPSRCFWPTWVLNGVHLRRLSMLDVRNEWGWDLRLNAGTFHYPDLDMMAVPGLRESCPMLRTIIWAVEYLVPETLYEGHTEGVAPIQLYVRMLCDTLPNFVRLAVYDEEETVETPDGLFYGDIWTRENKDSDEPDTDVVDKPRWLNEAFGTYLLDLCNQVYCNSRVPRLRKLS